MLGSTLLLCVPGCGGGGEGDSAEELRNALGLSHRDEVHRIVLGGWGSSEHLAPTTTRIRPGTYVEFATVDHRVHTITFLPDSLTPEGAAFLQRTNQLGSPPLLQRGSRFVVSFRDAPPGRYPFLSEAHGDTAVGVIVVSMDPSP